MEEKLLTYKDQTREGLIKYTRKAFRTLPKMVNPHILDIGCGSGVPTLELAKLSEGEVIAIDTDQTALERLAGKINEAGLAARIKAEKCSLLNMHFADASFDIIWAEGSINIIGFEKGLKEWRRFLKIGGFLVVHDDANDRTEKRKQIAQHGYKLIDYFVLNETTWWNEYCAPLEKRLNKIRAKHSDDQKAVTLLNEYQREIDIYKQNPKNYRSVFFIMRKE